MNWIAVTDEAPPKGEWVILAIAWDDDVAYAYLTPDGWCVQQPNGKCVCDCYGPEPTFESSEITHWVRTPKPPTDER